MFKALQSSQYLRRDIGGLSARLSYQQLNPGRDRGHRISKFMGGDG
jgi:hypothetical protein